MITIENATILYGENLEDFKANLLIDDSQIVEVSPHVKKGKIIDARRCIVTPSFINSHVHLGDSVAMDLGDGKHIDELIKPPDGLKHRILSYSPQSMIINHMRKSLQNMLKTGTTTFVDFREGGLEGIDIINKAAEGVPISKIILGRHQSFLNPQMDPSEIASIVEELVDICDGVAPSGLGEITDPIAAAIAQTSKRLGKLSAIHAAEYETLQRNSVENTGKTEVQRAIEAGFNLLIHLTAPLNDDLELVAKSETPVVLCPRSNGALGVGIPPLKEMLEAGIKILLGTDNLMFNSPNMFREMEYALKVTRAYYKDYLPPHEILKMATVNATQALKLNTGCIFEGKIADLLIIKQISSNPFLSIINRTEPGDIKHLIREGEIIQ